MPLHDMSMATAGAGGERTADLAYFPSAGRSTSREFDFQETPMRVKMSLLFAAVAAVVGFVSTPSQAQVVGTTYVVPGSPVLSAPVAPLAPVGTVVGTPVVPYTTGYQMVTPRTYYPTTYGYRTWGYRPRMWGPGYGSRGWGRRWW